MADYVPTIGLEVHAELKTNTKMFCQSANNASEIRPNVNICPVCMAHPGTLPVINREAVRHVLRVGVAVNASLADYTEFDRKNYFYPDLPKGYQLSQFEFPLVSGGELNGVAITRVHLEEDTASSIHDPQSGDTLVDYNRAGVPLMELVTEPVIHSAKQAGDFGRDLQLLLRYLGASNADMEKGEMRLEANISVSNDGNLGTKVEVKNINSFRAMERAVDYEIKRQIGLLEKGEKVIQETRGWDDGKQSTFSQRLKEGSADYRYFPDPDLPSLKISELPDLSREVLRKSLPELPEGRKSRYVSLGIKPVDAAQFATYPYLGDFIDELIERHPSNPKLIERSANYITNDIVSLVRDIEERDSEKKDKMPISAEYFEKIMLLVEGVKLSSRGAKDLLMHTIKENRDPEVIAQERGLLIDASLDMGSVIDGILNQNVSVVADYKAGKEAALQFLIGQGMKALKGAVNPAELKAAMIARMSKIG